jgi:hypothetical protein
MNFIVIHPDYYNVDQIETRQRIFLGALGILSEAGGSKEFLTAKTQRAPRNAIVL